MNGARTGFIALGLVLCCGTALAQSKYPMPQTGQQPIAKKQPAVPQPAPTLAKTHANAVSNGGFESNGGAGTNTFTDWTVVDQSGGAGTWYVQTGTTSPDIGAFLVDAPPEGSFAAMSDQTGPGSHVLYQDVTVPAEGGTLSFALYIANRSGAFSSPATLDYTVSPNQQFRMDIMSTAAGDFDVGAGVLANVYQTQPGDPLTSSYTTISFPMGAFAGQTVRLRFAEVDNQGNFNVGVDSVQLTANQPIPVLDRTGSALLMILLAALGAMFVPAFRRG